MRVTTNVHGYLRKYTIQSFISEGAYDKTFPIKNEEGELEEITVADYFKKTYDVTIRLKYAPLVLMSNKALVPLETLKVAPNQRYSNALTTKQTSEVFKFSRIPPTRAEAFLKSYIQSDKSDFSLLKSFDIHITKEQVQTTGTQLSPPMLSCGRPCKPNQGCWDNNKCMEVARPLRNVLAVCMSPGISESFVVGFFNHLSKVMTVPSNQTIITCGIEEFKDKVGAEVQKAGMRHIHYDMIFVFMTNTDTTVYNTIKRTTDLRLGIPSQVVCTSRICSMSYIYGISLKINAKLGGLNQVLLHRPTLIKSSEEHVMVCGADVTHPSKGDKLISVAGVVGTYDQNFMRYASEARTQLRRKEVITQLGEMMESLFNCYYRKNGHVPAKVIFYRDGISDSMFEVSIKKEVPQIYLAFRRCFPLYPEELKLTFIICQKKHNVRLFPEHKYADSKGSAIPGLVIDHEITSSTFTDFYLQSHPTRIGTGRSCRYITLIDDNDYDLEELEMFTYSLCYLLNRCTMAISICAPARYAHLVCFRARSVLGMSGGDLSQAEMSSEELPDFQFPETMKDKMFYI